MSDEPDTCQDCGRETDDLRLTSDSHPLGPNEFVCPECTAGPSLSPGDRVLDLVDRHDPDRDEGAMLVIEVHETRADEWLIEGLGMTVEEAAADEWSLATMDDSYDSAADDVAEVVFIEALDRKAGSRWFGKTPSELRALCENEGVTTYSYHAARLSRATSGNTVTLGP